MAPLRLVKRDKMEVLRHYLASLAYRFQKAIYEAPQSFENFESGSGVRTPKQILNHMCHVLLYAKTRLNENHQDRIPAPEALSWQDEVNRFHAILYDIDQLLLKYQVDINQQKTILQGPLTDVMTHIGQLALLRRLAGEPVKGENFMKAKINTGKVDRNQNLNGDSLD